ncbi:triose-phosphate isomerase family protein [Sinomonas mesophila]|uniref:triose-phosphate isomerase family protein n=1 Tax=Sinomonas mesophila TaxID=1531955 RepID=UPI000985F07B|nr:triose-phosphate isomerase family protein [Sinomonas mesophila]
MAPTPRFLIGVSTKMYFSHARTVQWCRGVAALAGGHAAVRGGHAGLFVVPGYLSVLAAREILDGVADVGAQDLAAQDAGAYTGEVSGAQIAEAGCTLVEIGHAERRRLFGEDDAVVRAKTTAALHSGLTPLLCIGEARHGPPEAAARECIRQIDDALAAARASGASGRLIAAYEPHWAIGAPEPAPPSYITAVTQRVREHVRSLPDFPGSSVIYGGSAGPGLLTAVADGVDGLFLGRFAHDPAAVGAVLDEVSAVVAGTPADSIGGAGGTHV